MSIQELKDFIVVANASIAVFVALSSAIGTWVLLRWRVARIEKVVFGNGVPGVLSRLEHLEVAEASAAARCDERHRRTA